MAITTVSSHVVSVNAIQGTLIADNAITAVHIATNAVSGTLIADNAVTAVHIAQNSITVTQLADDCVESDKIADGIITTNHLNKAMISSQTEVTPVAGDFVLLGDTSDSNNLKKAPLTLLLNSNVDLSSKANLATPQFTNRVGIGVAAHGTAALNITSTAQHMRLNNGSELGVISLESDGALRIWSHGDSNNEIEFYQGSGSGAASMTINSSGNVAIGTTSASTPLHVRYSSAPNSGGNRNTVEDVLTLEATGYFPYGGYGMGINFQGEDYGNTAIRDYGKIQALMRGHSDQNSSGDPSFSSDLAFWTNTGGASNTVSTEKMRITNAGNVGIGSDNPSAKLHVEGTGDSQILIYETGTSPYTATLKLASQSTTAYGANVQYTSGAEQLTIENFGRTISSTDDHGSIRFRTKVGNSSMQEVLHINGYAGNVGIGTSSPAKPLHLKVASGWATMRLEGAGDSGGELEFYATSTKKGSIWFGNDGGFNVRVNGADDTIKINSSRVMAFGGANPLGTNSGTIQAGGDVLATDSFGTLGTHLQITYTAGTDQELRIFRSNGNRVATFTESETFLLGKTTGSLTSAGMQVTPNDFMAYTNTSTDTGDRLLVLNQQNRSSGDLLEFRTGNSNVGKISLNTSGNMVYGGTSDYRLKENVNYTWSATAKLKQLKPCEFEWKSDNYDAVNQGFLAHEVAAIVPQAVIGSKDGVDKDNNPSYQQLDNSTLVPLLVKTIQELEARIATLEG